MTTTPDQLTDRDLVATLDEWMAAIVANDAERIGGFMAEEWIMVSENGIATAERFLGLVRSGELTHSAMRRVGEARVRYHGDLALLTTRATNTAHYLGTRFDADEWTTDVFTHAGGRWLCLLTQITAANA
ncbi:nuclear transport factor 2 family protein [Nocardia asteroides]|uniref:nuclear transport factor 2 family protein n=1 Tax=Nocardia asteroides TaxID=1824 RepID=UPI001E3FBF69|nr:nuclear transport factor 2 family protein [Nocardia asteroides]UGT53913.1 nuclear transport factor 2 family protein [Nocardia asteroides]